MTCISEMQDWIVDMQGNFVIPNLFYIQACDGTVEATLNDVRGMELKASLTAILSQVPTAFLLARFHFMIGCSGANEN